MRYLSVYRSEETGVPPTPETIAAMGALIEEMTKSGELIATEGCLPSSRGARVRLAKGKVTVTDGPFSESKEIIGGFALLEARDKAHAVELIRKFLAVAGDGECELRELYSEPAGAGPGDKGGRASQPAPANR